MVQQNQNKVKKTKPSTERLREEHQPSHITLILNFMAHFLQVQQQKEVK